jgi:hypothetical protein
MDRSRDAQVTSLTAYLLTNIPHGPWLVIAELKRILTGLEIAWTSLSAQHYTNGTTRVLAVLDAVHPFNQDQLE